MEARHSLVSLVIVFAVLLVAGTSTQATVVKDHASDSTWWQDVAMADHFLDPSPAWAAIGGATIVGNGEELERVGMVWAHSSLIDFSANGGDIEELQYRFRFFASTADFSLDAMYAPPPQANWAATFTTPVNADWRTVIGQFLGVFNLRYSELDVSSLHIPTVPGQTHVVVLVPESKLETPGIITALSVSSAGAGAIGDTPDWWHTGADLGGVGPASLPTIGLWPGGDFFAYKVTTVAAGTPADLDSDGDVDLIDFSAFQGCFNGPNRPPAQTTCTQADLDSDNDVDLIDFSVFQGCFNGPNRPPACR